MLTGEAASDSILSELSPGKVSGMAQIYDLASLDWQLAGWHPFCWLQRKSMELGVNLGADIPAIPARVPGSVQGALRDAGLLPDWNVQLNSRQCEWVENRHWTFWTTLPQEWIAQSGQKLLHCEGLDYQGAVLVNGHCAGEFCGSFVPYTFDLTPYLQDGDNQLVIVFTANPRELGQVQFTSKIKEWKPRFNYIWDWTPRLVQVGIWDALRLEVRQDAAVETLRAYTEYDPQDGLGAVTLAAQLQVGSAAWVEVLLTGAAGEVYRQSFPATTDFRQRVSGFPVHAWQPNGNGAQPLYTLAVCLLAADGTVLDEAVRSVGFRHITWKPCQGTPTDAEPWICNINGHDTFLQGANWVPIRPNFADVTEEDYRQRLALYRELGFNLLRVWGGAVLERECFYRLCDEYGLLVWQEFPLSSSGIENWPPEDPDVIAEMRQIAESYVARRQHHASLLLWCGGNELQGSHDGRKTGCGKPVDNTHPMMAMMAALVSAMDPTRRFIPTSSSGPNFMAEARNRGKGVHHDVHGPWNHTGALEDGWFDYWDGDDALFRSETGMPGAGPADLIRQYGGELALPADRSNPFWMHTSGWWIQWDDYLREGGHPDDLEQFVAWSQQRQATALAYAARACKRRFPACGGFIVWMGHDCYPCPSNTSIIDYLGRPKPAALALTEVFTASAVTKETIR